MTKNSIAEYEAILENEELPWPPEDVIQTFYVHMRKQRESKSQQWMSSWDEKLKDLETLNANQAKQLMGQLLNSPLFLTQDHKDHLVVLGTRTK